MALTQATLPAWDAFRALADLDAMGITFSRLLPDLTCSAAMAKLRLVVDTAGGAL